MKFKTIEKKAIILCGGKGERLRPLTKNFPKPLIKIKNEPILSHIVRHLKMNDINDFIFATGYKSETIEKYLKNERKDISFEISNSGDVDIIKRIQDAGSLINGDFLVLYGDTLSDIDIKKLIQDHNMKDQTVTMAVWPLQSQFGLVEIDSNGKVLSFVEKPILNKWINIGYFYFNHEMLELTYEYKKFADFLKALAIKNLLNAFRHRGIHITVNTVEELNKAENNIEKILKKDDNE